MWERGWPSGPTTARFRTQSSEDTQMAAPESDIPPIDADELPDSWLGGDRKPDHRCRRGQSQTGGGSDGNFVERLRARVAVPTESQMPGCAPALLRYCSEALGPMVAAMGFEVQVLDNPDAKRGPIMLATRMENPTSPTVLIYGHGDVVR